MLSEEILTQRAGNFTASENHKLMAGWDTKKPDTDFEGFDELYNLIKDRDTKPTIHEFKEFNFKVTGVLINKVWSYIQYLKPPKGLITYAKEKANEELFDFDPSLKWSTVHTINGEERELECMEELTKSTGLNFIHTGNNQTHIHANGIGCTPDGVVLDDIDLVLTGAEAKCKSPQEHAKNLLINNNDDLKENAFDHFVQIQTQMLVTDTDHWYFANFNPFAKSKKHKFKYIIVSRDDEFIEILKSRIELAKKIKAEFLNELNQLREVA